MDNKLALVQEKIAAIPQRYEASYQVNLTNLKDAADIKAACTSLSLATIDQALEAPTVRDLERAIGTKSVLILLTYEISRINQMFNGNDKLRLKGVQPGEIAMMILEEFPYESIEDFFIAFRKGITGAYDDKVLRLDIQVFCSWIRKYLEQKAEANERKIKRAQEDHAAAASEPASKEAIQKIIDESWVGEALREQDKNEAGYQKFKAERLKRLQEEKLKKDAGN